MSNIFKKNKNLLNIAIITVIAIFFVADRILKNIALRLAENESHNVLSDIIRFRFIKNYNISFSLPINGIFLNCLIITILTFIVIFIIYSIIKKKKQINGYLYLYLLGALYLGALSNFIDRLKFDYVIDYIEVKNFSVLNIADIMISVSAIIIIYLNFRNEREKIKIVK